ncbi:hypothetical protein Sme01_40610 [Sphaerisporangium melleum]|uniref:Uncharacterized protein n=1 Tax=Sphaerisporangium melleum TaxID=321316 RepID=A0A917VP20_9ACTN|nr:hypothetical protein [Sphaerisporangium melleum]GGL00672.1 hypothetical protein GCM10007964_48410 [Sphaerisporangium melleum]GII71585.1 hypothetical protein Sme01_40610 [Sphaerisporangium melleum]
MDRDGNPRSPDEDPLKQTGPFDIDWTGEPESPRGDLLSDGWAAGHEPAHGDDHPRAEHPEHSEFEPGRSPDATALQEGYDPDGPEHYGEGYPADDYERPEGYARPDEEGWAPDGEHDPEGEERRGFLGSGWTGEDDAEEEKRSKNKGLILAMVAIVVLAVAGGWIVSSSVGSKPEAACAAPANCSPAGEKLPETVESPAADPSGEATGPAATPEETLTGSPTPSASPSTTPTVASRPQTSEEPSTRPSPTRTRHSSAPPTPRSSDTPQQQPENPRVQDDEPSDPPSSSAPPPPPPSTQAPPPPAPTPERNNGGLLDWLF